MDEQKYIREEDIEMEEDSDSNGDSDDSLEEMEDEKD